MLRYLAATDMLHPPHVASPVDMARMTTPGLDPESTAMATLLPQLRNGVVWG
jgi:hypothetical protein